MLITAEASAEAEAQRRVKEAVAATQALSSQLPPAEGTVRTMAVDLDRSSELEKAKALAAIRHTDLVMARKEALEGRTKMRKTETALREEVNAATTEAAEREAAWDRERSRLTEKLQIACDAQEALAAQLSTSAKDDEEVVQGSRQKVEELKAKLAGLTKGYEAQLAKERAEAAYHLESAKADHDDGDSIPLAEYQDALQRMQEATRLDTQ